MEFLLETAFGKTVNSEGIIILLHCHYERWQRHMVITGMDKRLSMLRIGIELTTPFTDSFGMIQSGWYGYKLHIPSSLPVQPVRMYTDFKIHQSQFE